MTQGIKPKRKLNFLERTLSSIDSWQSDHPFFGFIYAVVKKFGDDKAGREAALITYYGFLSLFPLLLAATSLAGILSKHSIAIQQQLNGTIDSYFPVLGEGLQASIHGSSKSGIALIIGLLIALYGARGIADAIRSTLDQTWAVPRTKRTGFPLNILKSFGILLGTSIGVVVTTGLASLATAALGHAWYVRIIPLIINAVLLYLIFIFIYKVGTSRKHKRADIRLGAVVAVIGLLILQTLGGYLILHQMHNLSGLYGQFALVLALLFWIYLQAQVFVYAIEINVVHTYKLWPRSLIDAQPTTADRKAYQLYAERDKYAHIPENEASARQPQK
ncbi:MAG: YihY/virulence factor BrkB family protein [Candidatus Saccharimonadales bacterium]